MLAFTKSRARDLPSRSGSNHILRSDLVYVQTMAEIEMEVNGVIAKDLNSLLSSPARDFLIRNDGEQVKIESMKGKKIGLYFSAAWCGPCQRFTPQLVEVYNKLSPKFGFEIVFVSGDEDEESFNDYFAEMPWLAVPFTDSETRDRLDEVFEVRGIPNLVIIDEEGKLVNEDAVDVIRNYGADAYPFTPEKFEELKAIEIAKLEAQTLDSLLVSGDLNYVLGKDGAKVLVSELVGKNILLYFSAHWCPPCRAFTPKLVEVYKQIKEKNEAFELVFISSDRDQESYDEYYSQMPWLALPFGDPRKTSLARTFKVSGIPMLVALGPTGKTVTKEAKNLVGAHGADAYTFTEERLKEIEAKYNEMAKDWPVKVKHALHEEHELELTRVRGYLCDMCDEEGKIWSYHCDECDFDLHAKCALKEEEKATGHDAVKEGGRESEDGWVCDGNVCTKA